MNKNLSITKEMVREGIVQKLIKVSLDEEGAIVEIGETVFMEDKSSFGVGDDVNKSTDIPMNDMVEKVWKMLEDFRKECPLPFRKMYEESFDYLIDNLEPVEIEEIENDEDDENKTYTTTYLLKIKLKNQKGAYGVILEVPVDAPDVYDYIEDWVNTNLRAVESFERMM